MRIITGSLKGRRLDVPVGVDIRPTSDFTKGGIFNILESRKGLAGAHVLDLFSGTGNLGFEAISRGAASAVMVEADRFAATAITKTADRFGVGGQVTVVNTDAASYLGRSPVGYDVVFADPPYEYADMPGLADTVLSSWLATDGWFILEHDVRHNFTSDPRCVFAKPYGKTIVSIFKL
jgi:16S rRNA (guanine(966)-N(2))-methyltransferase RsmD